MHYAPLLILLAIFFLSALFFVSARPVFAVRIGGGTARAARGEVPGRLLVACADAARARPALVGEVRGVRSGGELRLHFSRSIPEDVREQVEAACASGRADRNPPVN